MRYFPKGVSRILRCFNESRLSPNLDIFDLYISKPLRPIVRELYAGNVEDKLPYHYGTVHFTTMERRRLPATTGPTPRSTSVSKTEHGANSPAVLSVVSETVRGVLIGTYRWIVDSDAVAIEQYCRAKARARLLDDYI